MLEFLRKLLRMWFPTKSTPTTLSDEDASVEQFFTNFEYPRQIFEELTSAKSPSKRLLVIYGIGSVGKSTLLIMYYLSCLRRHIAMALVRGEEARSAVDVLDTWSNDLRNNNIILPTLQNTLAHYHALDSKVENSLRDTPGIAKVGKQGAEIIVRAAASAIPIPIVNSLVGDLSATAVETISKRLQELLSKTDLEFYLDPVKRLTDDFLKDLSRVNERHQIVLAIDTFEQMTTLDNWVRNVAKHLSENILLVIAGREMPQWERAWPGWMGKAKLVELKEMSSEDLRTVVYRYYTYIHGEGSPDPNQVESIVQFARGLPMVATTAVRLWVQYNIEDFQTVQPQVLLDLVDRLMEGVSQEMRPAFEVAGILRYFNVEVLQALLDQGDATDLFSNLRRWPFIRPRSGGLAVHDTMREMMNRALYMSKPEYFHILHERAALYYEAKLENAKGEERERFTLERIYHRVLADEESGIKLFQQTAEELVLYHFILRLNTLLKDIDTFKRELDEVNSLLWLDYYKARLADIEGQTSDAEKIYQKISENKLAETKLRAYAFCDLGNLLQGSLAVKTFDAEKCIQLIENGLALSPLDSKLVIGLTRLSEAYYSLERWDDSLSSLEKAKNFCSENRDYYGVAYICNREKYHYMGRSLFTQAFQAQQEGLEALTKLSEQFYLKGELLGGYGIAWMWVGLYGQAEYNMREALEVTKQVGAVGPLSAFYRGLGAILGAQDKFGEANAIFAEGQSIMEKVAEGTTGLGILWSFWGRVLSRQGELSRAEEYLKRGRSVLGDVDKWNSFYHLIPLGELYELLHEWSQAESYYRLCIDLRWGGRSYFVCVALVGLIRVMQAQEKYDTIPSLLAEAEQMAQEYEFNDCLASLRATQGHLAWKGNTSEWGEGFDAALRLYQQALIFALRYNRFLLDELLSGRSQGSPLCPIITFCLNHEDEGQRMLDALQNWWRTGTIDIGASRAYGNSTIPANLSLLEAERIARKAEVGDGSLQHTVLEQLGQALAAFH